MKGPEVTAERGRGASKRWGTLEDSPQSLLPFILRYKGPGGPSPIHLVPVAVLKQPFVGTWGQRAWPACPLSSEPHPWGPFFPPLPLLLSISAFSSLDLLLSLPTLPSPVFPSPRLLPFLSLSLSLSQGFLPLAPPLPFPPMWIPVTWPLLPHMGTELPSGSGGLRGTLGPGFPRAFSSLVSAVP